MFRKATLPTPKSFGTTAIHAGQPADPQSGAVMVPISLSTTFAQESPGVTKVIKIKFPLYSQIFALLLQLRIYGLGLRLLKKWKSYKKRL